VTKVTFYHLVSNLAMAHEAASCWQRATYLPLGGFLSFSWCRRQLEAPFRHPIWETCLQLHSFTSNVVTQCWANVHIYQTIPGSNCLVPIVLYSTNFCRTEQKPEWRGDHITGTKKSYTVLKYFWLP